MSNGERSGRCTDRQDWEDVWRTMPSEVAWTHTDENVLRLLLGLLAHAPTACCLETGSGSGHISLRLARNRGECVLVDYVHRALLLGQRQFHSARVGGMFVGADIRTLPFADGVFDLAWNAGVLQTVPPGEQRALLAEMKRVTRPGGWVAAIVPRTDSALYRGRRRRLEKGGRWPYGRFESPSSEIRESFESTGFEVVQVQVFGPLDGLAEVRAFGRLISFALNRTPLGRPLERSLEAFLPGRGYWALMAGRNGRT